MRIYVDTFILGLTLGWGPCLSFCAPIVLPYIVATQKGWLKGLQVSLAFSLTRIIPYVILSLISAAFGQFLINRFYQGQAGLIIYVATGIFISLLGIVILIDKSQHFHLCPPAMQQYGQAGLFSKKIGLNSGIKEMILLGFIVGFAPCVPLLGLLAYIAVNAQNLLQAALLGLIFGLGTLISPLLLLGTVAGESTNLLLKRPLVYKIFSYACGAVLIYLGIGMTVRALRIL